MFEEGAGLLDVSLTTKLCSLEAVTDRKKRNRDRRCCQHLGLRCEWVSNSEEKGAHMECGSKFGLG